MLKILIEIALTFLISSASSLLGQQVFAATESKPQMRMFTSGDVVFLPETGAVILLKDKTLIVDMVNPADQRSKEYQSIDLKQNDEVLMINGKKVVVLSDLKAAYDSLATGSDVKLGIRRGKDMMIVSFPKSDQAKSTQHRVMTFESSGAGDDVKAVENGKQVTSIHASDGDVAVVMELGMIVGELDSKVKVAGLIEGKESEVKNAGVLEGDIITAINSQKITSVNGLIAAYEKVAVGTEFTVSLDRNGKTVTVKAVKAATEDGPKMIKTIKNN